ncbi:MAG: hypothetical protein HYZ56_00665, partial [Nitrosopumilales archaeon]|nr:hypothetical protein [Nitrosopumilales archaeon]
KFVQLPVIIPPPDKRNLLHYTYSLFILPDNNTKERQAIEDVAKKIQLQENFSEESIKNEIKSYGVTNDLQEIVMRGVIAKQTQQQISQAYHTIDAKKTSYSDSNVEVIDQAMKAVSSFSNNPREMKRFLNVLRFSYFIHEGRKALRLGVPTIDQLTQWIVLTMKWPQFVLWLHKRSGGISYDKKSESRTREILETLEDASVKDIDTWTREIKTQFNITSDIDDDKLSWLYDENLKNFFAEERKLPSPLSDASEKGLY